MRGQQNALCGFPCARDEFRNPSGVTNPAGFEKSSRGVGLTLYKMNRQQSCHGTSRKSPLRAGFGHVVLRSAAV